MASLSPPLTAEQQRWLTHVQDVATFRMKWLADASWKTARTAMLAYILMCIHFGLDPVPPTGIPDIYLSAFILFLVQDKKAFSTIKTYLSMGPRVLQLLHLGTWTQISDRPTVLQSLRAARRVLGDTTKHKIAITPTILLAFHALLDFNDPEAVVLYTAFLVAFWGFLRKSNVVVGRRSETNAQAALKRSSISVDSTGRMWLELTRTKTIHFQERKLVIPMPHLPNQPELCASTWLLRCLALDPLASSDTLLFSVPGRNARGQVTRTPLTYSRFVAVLKRLLTLTGHDASGYAGQSFRRGGATFAHASGVSAEFIKLHGDWRSNAYQLYTGVSTATQLAAIQRMSAALSRS